MVIIVIYIKGKYLNVLFKLLIIVVVIWLTNGVFSSIFTVLAIEYENSYKIIVVYIMICTGP